MVVERPAIRIGEVDARQAQARSTGVGEFDRVLGGGLVRGAVVLVAGEPGIGKSTLLLDVAARAARQEQTVLYVSGEESAAQIRMRAERIEAMARNLFLAAETDLATVLGHIDQIGPDLVIIDSVQTIASGDVEGAAGNVSQIREVAASLIQLAKSRGISILLVGHVTKDGSIAGPRVLEHLVDVVIQFEGERHSRLRLVRAVKNRYGPTDEVGCFDLSDVGIVGLADPSGLFAGVLDVFGDGSFWALWVPGHTPGSTAYNKQLQIQAQMCAAINRHIVENPASWYTPTAFYASGQASNSYSAFWHNHAIGGQTYGFAYDDVGGFSSSLYTPVPTTATVLIGF